MRYLPQNILVNQKATFFNDSKFHFHINCNGISASEYKQTRKEPDVMMLLGFVKSAPLICFQLAFVFVNFL